MIDNERPPNASATTKCGAFLLLSMINKKVHRLLFSDSGTDHFLIGHKTCWWAIHRRFLQALKLKQIRQEMKKSSNFHRHYQLRSSLMVNNRRWLFVQYCLRFSRSNNWIIEHEAASTGSHSHTQITVKYACVDSWILYFTFDSAAIKLSTASCRKFVNLENVYHTLSCSWLLCR